MSEDDFRQRVRTALKGCDVMRVETGIHHGVPDLNVCRLGVEAWVELKIEERRGILLRPAQFAWGTRRASHGGRVCVISSLNDWVRVDRFPLSVVRVGEYLAITSAPHKTFPLNQLSDLLKTILFSL